VQFVWCVSIITQHARGECLDIDTSPLPAFDDAYKQEEVEEVEEEVFNGTVAAGVKAGTSKGFANYTEKEDIAVLDVWESISLNALTDDDQSGKKYWQRIEDKFHRLRPKTSEGASRTL
jgi:hypothetical protein